MYSTTCDRLHYVERTGSHSTKESRRGIIRVVPRWAETEEQIEQERALSAELTEKMRVMRANPALHKKAAKILRKGIYMKAQRGRIYQELSEAKKAVRMALYIRGRAEPEQVERVQAAQRDADRFKEHWRLYVSKLPGYISSCQG